MLAVGGELNTQATTRGMLFVHSTPPALCQHIEWALSSILGIEVKLDWVAQPISENLYCTEYSWVAPVGTGAKIASAIRGWEQLRYEVTEESTTSTLSSRWLHTPDLGIFYTLTDENGNFLIDENRVNEAISSTTQRQDLVQKLNLATGTMWDNELEPFRQATSDMNIKWIHQ